MNYVNISSKQNSKGRLKPFLGFAKCDGQEGEGMGVERRGEEVLKH